MVEHTHHDEEDEHKKHNHSNHKHEIKMDTAHEDDGLDPHIWLDPISVKIQAKNIYEAMVKIDEENSDFYKANYEEFVKELR